MKLAVEADVALKWKSFNTFILFSLESRVQRSARVNRELKIYDDDVVENARKQWYHWLKSINNRAARAARILAHIFAVLCLTTTWNH